MVPGKTFKTQSAFNRPEIPDISASHFELWGGAERGGEANVLPSVVVALASPKERTSREAFGSLLEVWLRPPIQNTPHRLTVSTRNRPLGRAKILEFV
jgi:hypothetical protein